jgi:phytoene synthase
MSLKEDYAFCEDIIRKNSSSFYKAFSKLPENKRQAVYAIYAFCRISDDAIDVEQSPEVLSKLKDQLNDLSANHNLIIDSPVFRALKDSFDRFHLDVSPFYEMLEGQEMDINFKPFEDLKQLEKYCYFVAGTVGLMLLPVLAADKHEMLKDAAVHLGIAMQITNILRDIGEDADRGRVYLPLDLIARYNYSLEDLKKKVVSRNFIELWEALAKAAEEHYNKFMPSLELFDEDSRDAVGKAALYYRSILDAVRKADYNCMTQRCYVNLKEAVK